MTQTPADDRPAPGPLAGLRVLELGQLIAGPFTGTLLAYFGAEVIKIEPPEGDPIRQWRVVRDGTSLWWHSIGRNKKSVRIDLKTGEGRALVGQLAARCDVLVENFRPGTLEKWGLGPEVLKAANPGLVIARISGYGQDGPYAGKAGYASVCEGFGGLRYVNGMPGEPPVRPNLSIGDTLAALHAVIGILMALHQRGRSGSGQVVDVALFEAVYNLLESVVPEFDGAGVVREPSGTTVTGIVPTNTYRCADGRWAIIGGNGDSIYKRLMRAAGRADLADDPRLAHNPGRVQHEAEIDAAIAAWTATLPLAEVVSSLETAGVPAGPIYSVRDMFADPQYQARGLFERVEIDGKPLAIPAIPPKLSATPGGTRWSGPAIGAHTGEVLGEWLGMDAEAVNGLRQRGVI
ncbi:MAG TPA: CaiB/BaiF CoA-transferase family protein [Plasticicumulans sp.]|uniref:CaiB/BaiF CoA transferase family protein n=1 Tax=Plasticicumulans sp. TaxID=2307179 RepID=UPI002CABA198|nr:CaiB/BaiF CoA-transferase family protein [Plasticicumulans sp.]HMZ11513.1 CaiB/BaiF CoA-transferase family protein [Plasticicumulans sp.]HNG50907.1 CaiB/BaiF CoA-transferase family protein [Plasticicumulans sp.]